MSVRMGLMMSFGPMNVQCSWRPIGDSAAEKREKLPRINQGM